MRPCVCEGQAPAAQTGPWRGGSLQTRTTTRWGWGGWMGCSETGGSSLGGGQCLECPLPRPGGRFPRLALLAGIQALGGRFREVAGASWVLLSHLPRGPAGIAPSALQARPSVALAQRAGASKEPPPPASPGPGFHTLRLGLGRRDQDVRKEEPAPSVLPAAGPPSQSLQASCPWDKIPEVVLGPEDPQRVPTGMTPVLRGEEAPGPTLPCPTRVHGLL